MSSSLVMSSTRATGSEEPVAEDARGGAVGRLPVVDADASDAAGLWGADDGAGAEAGTGEDEDDAVLTFKGLSVVDVVVVVVVVVVVGEIG